MAAQEQNTRPWRFVLSSHNQHMKEQKLGCRTHSTVTAQTATANPVQKANFDYLVRMKLVTSMYKTFIKGFITCLMLSGSNSCSFALLVNVASPLQYLPVRTHTWTAPNEVKFNRDEVWCLCYTKSEKATKCLFWTYFPHQILEGETIILTTLSFIFPNLMWCAFLACCFPSSNLSKTAAGMCGR